MLRTETPTNACTIFDVRKPYGTLSPKPIWAGAGGGNVQSDFEDPQPDGPHSDSTMLEKAIASGLESS